MTNNDILGSFPKGYEPNDSQKYILEEIENALDLGKEYIIIQAPTATGKSLIAKSFANLSKKCSFVFEESVNNYSIFSFLEKLHLGQLVTLLAEYNLTIMSFSQLGHFSFAGISQDLKSQSGYPSQP